MTKAAIVTGATSGIGRATAVALAQAGFDVGLTWRVNQAAAHQTARQVRSTGHAAYICRLDLSDPDATHQTILHLAGKLGHLDALVNNAAVNHRASLTDETVADFHRVLAVNLIAPLVATKAAVQIMLEQHRGGRIVNVTSIHEHAPLRAGGAYAAAKAGLGMLTQVHALELAAHAITVNAVAPGHIVTPMNGCENPDATLPRDAIPAGRAGQPHEVAAVIAHLCSAEAAYVNGASIPVDGALAQMTVAPLQDELDAITASTRRNTHS